MELISTAKSTNLVSFDTLKSKFRYCHLENESRDFRFLGRQKLFLEVNRASGFEMLRLKESEKNVNEILLVRKMKVDNLYCLGCPKQAVDFVALGLSSGQIGLLNYRNNEYVTKFPADGVNNGVIFLDLNASDEYLSSVYENGLINIYGLKTKTKLESLHLDKDSSLARFHPSKRFHLFVASCSGAVYIYDIQSKKRIFRATDFHSCPCRDLCTSVSTPDIIFSVGYDCILNVLDTRRKLSPQQIRCNHPLSSVDVSDCGRYCVTGNLKGELISYDLRNLKDYLQCSQVHDSPVVRVGFVPSEEGSINISSMETSGNVLAETQNLPASDEKNTKPRRDSFLDFINCNSFRGRETLSRRDSFNLQGLERKNYDFDPRTSVDGRSCLDAKMSLDLKSINDMLPDVSENDPAPMHAGSKFKMRRSSIECMISEKNPKSKFVDDLIEEEVFEEVSTLNKAKDNVQLERKHEEISVDINIDESSKENILNESRKDISFLIKLPDDKNSTPNPSKRGSVNVEAEAKVETVDSIEIKAVLDEIKSLRVEMNSRLKTLETEIKFHADSNKSDFYMQNFNLWKNQMNVSEEIRTLLLSLLRADPFVMEFLRLQEENEQLKQTLNSIRKVR